MSLTISQPGFTRAYPTQSAAAAMLCVAESTLSRAIRRHGIVVQRAGDRDRHVAAGDVLRLNDIFRRKIAEELAGELVAYAETREPSLVDVVAGEVTAGLELLSAPGLDGEGFLDELRRVLPARLYHEVERIYRTTIPGRVAIVAVTGVGGDVAVRETAGPSAPMSVAG